MEKMIGHSNKAAAWLGRLSNLNVSKTAQRGPAPHKPLLMLCIIDMVEDGVINSPWVPYSPELFFRFQCYWPIVLERQQNKPDMRMPFHALGGARDRIWLRYTEDGVPSKSKETTRICRLDESLWNCLQDHFFRTEARLRLITNYFTASEQIALCAKLCLSEPSTEEIAAIRQTSESYKLSLKKGRDLRFRNDVLISYRFTCALTGYSLNTTKENLVEAAHIHQHALSGNDDSCNGLALTPNAHWMFDRGLWTVDLYESKFIILVGTGSFTDSSPYGRSLNYFHKKPLFFANNTTLRPDPKHLAWHRKNRFTG